MKLGYNLNLEQSQKLIMTTELRQAIEILQLNSIELKDYISDEVEKNPLLEYDNNSEEVNSRSDESIDWKSYVKSQGSFEGNEQEYDSNGEEFSYDNYIAYEKTLMEHLIDQVGLLDLDCLEKAIALEMVQNIDPSGYLKIEVEEIGNKFKVELGKVESILKRIQRLDPIGIGSRTLEECLILQIDYDSKNNSYIESIIKNNLEDLANNRIQKISKDIGLNIKETQELVDYIKTLDPKPGNAFNDGGVNEVEYIIPDAEIRLVDGEYKVFINDITGPRFQINNFYKSLLDKDDVEKDTNDFLNNSFNRAMWMIKAIEQRRNTIKKVLEAIIDFQKDFFVKGDRGLAPLTLKEVAESIEMHESTVSRVSNEKYVQTPRGLFEIKYFFCTGLDCDLGEVSSKSIKEVIRDIIDGEDTKKPYSDQKISELLKETGIDISRRTVAKYRDELNILSSSMRRRY